MEGRHGRPLNERMRIEGSLPAKPLTNEQSRSYMVVRENRQGVPTFNKLQYFNEKLTVYKRILFYSNIVTGWAPRVCADFLVVKALLTKSD